MDCENKTKQPGQLDSGLKKTISEEKKVENGIRSRSTSSAKNTGFSMKVRNGGQPVARKNIYYPPTSYYDYYYPGFNGLFGRRDVLTKAGDGMSMAPPSGYSFYVPANTCPSYVYQKQSHLRGGGPMGYQTMGRMCNGSRLNFRGKSTRKDDYEALDEITWGPRANKTSKSSDALCEDLLSEFTRQRDKYNVEDFPIEYGNAKFYIIKSYSEDDVHKSIKYDVWSSTPNGNKKLDTAFHEAEAKAKAGVLGKACPIFLFFSVNGSGQFVGLAEMVGKLDFNKTMDFWQLDKWSGFFPVKWHIIKDIPNSQLRHIFLDNNGNRPVTYTRDTQEVGLKQGIEMLKIFKGYSVKSSLLDDFEFYENREKSLRARKSGKPAAFQAEVCVRRHVEAEGRGGEAANKTNAWCDPVSSLVNVTKNLSINSSEQKVAV